MCYSRRGVLHVFIKFKKSLKLNLFFPLINFFTESFWVDSSRSSSICVSDIPDNRIITLIPLRQSDIAKGIFSQPPMLPLILQWFEKHHHDWNSWLVTWCEHGVTLRTEDCELPISAAGGWWLCWICMWIHFYIFTVLLESGLLRMTRGKTVSSCISVTYSHPSSS